MVLIFLHFFSFHLDLLKGIRSNESLLPQRPEHSWRRDIFSTTNTHTHKHNVLCMVLNQTAKVFPSLIIWQNNYSVKNTWFTCSYNYDASFVVTLNLSYYGSLQDELEVKEGSYFKENKT